MAINFVIEKNIPLPKNSIREFLEQLEIGDSFVMDADVNPGALLRNHVNALGMKITTRKVEDGKYRIWRTA